MNRVIHELMMRVGYADPEKGAVRIAEDLAHLVVEECIKCCKTEEEADNIRRHFRLIK